MRRLIINADDFGLTAGVNRGIVEAHGHGLVTSATLMANGPAFDEAVRLAQSVPRLNIGCHIVLVDGTPVLDRIQVSSLVAGHNQGVPRFRNGISSFALLATAGGLNSSQIEAEATAQIRKLQAAGIAVTHLDTHKHTHLFPSVLRPILRAALACGIRAVRNPFEPARFATIGQRPSLWIRGSQVSALRWFAGPFERALRDTGMIAPDGTVGMVVTGALDEGLFRSMIDSLPEGTWEFVCHPGYNDAQLQDVRTRLRESRMQELQLLTSDATRDFLTTAGVELISYRDLV